MKKLNLQRWLKLSGLLKEQGHEHLGDHTNKAVTSTALDLKSTAVGQSGAKAQKLCADIMQQKLYRLLVGYSRIQLFKKQISKRMNYWAKQQYLEELEKATDAEIIARMGSKDKVKFHPKWGSSATIDKIRVKYTEVTAGVGSGVSDVSILANALWLSKPVNVECKAGSGTIDVNDAKGAKQVAAFKNKAVWTAEGRDDITPGPGGMFYADGFKDTVAKELQAMRAALGKHLEGDLYFFISDNADTLANFNIIRTNSPEQCEKFVNKSSAAYQALAPLLGGNDLSAAQFLDRVFWGQDINYVSGEAVAEKLLPNEAKGPKNRNSGTRMSNGSIYDGATWVLQNGLNARGDRGASSWQIQIQKLPELVTMTNITSETYSKAWIDDVEELKDYFTEHQKGREKGSDGDFIDFRARANEEAIQSNYNQTRKLTGVKNHQKFWGNKLLKTNDVIPSAFHAGCKYIANQVNLGAGNDLVTAEMVLELAQTVDSHGNSSYGTYTKKGTGTVVFVIGEPPPLKPKANKKNWKEIIDGFQPACRNFLRIKALKGWQSKFLNNISVGSVDLAKKANNGETIEFKKHASELRELANMAASIQPLGVLIDYDIIILPDAGAFAKNTSEFSQLLPPKHIHSFWHRLLTVWQESTGSQKLFREGTHSRKIADFLLDSNYLMESFTELLELEPVANIEADEENLVDISDSIAIEVQDSQQAVKEESKQRKYSIVSRLFE